MKRVDKGPEPRFLVEYRGTADATYEAWSEVARLRGLLVERQHRVCVYCERRIAVEGSSVEHFRPRHGPHGAPELRLAWSNLWAVCDGGRRGRVQRCDASKGDRVCRLDPGTVTDAHFLFSADGAVRHVDPVADAELDDVLALNIAALRQSRAAALAGMLGHLQRRSGGSWSRELVERALARLDPAEPHAGYLRWWLRRKLTRT